MQDFGKIIVGIIIFLALLSVPVIVSQASGNADYVPESKLVLPDESVATECMNLYTSEYMRVHHMDLLFEYRSLAVRDDSDANDLGDVYWVDKDGNKLPFSLTGTCLSCHTDRDTFCNVCHDYMAVQPNCWDCHGYTGES